MTTHIQDRTSRLLRRAGLAAGMLASGLAFAAGPMLSGPSTLPAGQPGVFAGANFEPGALLTIRVADAYGNEHAKVVKAGADGKLSYEASGNADGVYVIRIDDAMGKTLASARFGVGR
jgi:hypothetical protein